MLMKATSTPVLRKFGFRSTLVWNSVLSMICVGLCAAFRPDWPLWTIYTILLLSGFFQSLQFSAYNTVAYAEVPSERFSSATSFYSTFQQLMLSLGICVAAAALHASVVWHGYDRARLPDFSVAFIVITLISLVAGPVCAAFPRNAGAEMSGHRSR
jgi:MFS family permease